MYSVASTFAAGDLDWWHRLPQVRERIVDRILPTTTFQTLARTARSL